MFNIFVYIFLPNKIWLTAIVAKLQFLAWLYNDFRAFRNVWTKNDEYYIIADKVMSNANFRNNNIHFIIFR